MAALKSPLPFSSRFASSVEDLVRTACSEEALSSTELAKQRFEKLQALNSEYQEMKSCFDNLWNKCRNRMTSTSEDISGVKDDVRDVKAATEELVHNVRMMDTETPIQLGESNIEELSVLASQTTSLKKSLESKLDTCDKNTVNTLNEIDSMRKDFQDIKAYTIELLNVEEKVRKIRDEDDAETTRYGTQSLDLIKESVTRFKETNKLLGSKLDECNENMITANKDLNEVRKDLDEVKESADILVKVARNDDGATSIRLGLQSLDQLGKLDSDCKKMMERLHSSLNECFKNMNETKNDIGELKFITKTLMKEAEWTISGHRPRTETIVEIDECIDKIRTIYSGSREVKESIDNKWRLCEQCMIDTEKDIIVSRKEISDVKDATEELVCAKHVRAANDTKSIRVGEQNILELKKLSSCERDIKRLIENRLNKYNQDAMNTKNDILNMKEMINEIKVINEEVAVEVQVSTGKLDDEVNNFGFDLARMEDFFPKELTKSREFINHVVKEINEINEELNEIKKNSDEVGIMVTTVDDRAKCKQIGSDSLVELQKILLESAKMKDSFESMLDTCNLKLSNMLEEVREVKSTSEVLVQEAHGQDREAISVRNIEENNIEKIKNLCSTSSSMKKVVNKKLEECNIDINHLRDIICKLNNKIVDMKAVISKMLWQIREEKTENDKVIQLCNDKLKKISLLYSYIAEMKESIDKKMDICDKNINEAKNDFIVSLNDMSNLKNEVNEVKDEMEVVRKLMTKLIEDIKCQDKIQRIEWSISNIKSVVENFQFKICPLSVTSGKAPDKPMESHNLLRKILMAFRDGAGLYLPDAVKNEEYPTSAQEETKKQEFRDRISCQIKFLIGSRPTISKKDDGRFSIFYS